MLAVSILLLGTIAASALGHMCLLNPIQRPPNNDFNTLGAPDCNLVASPCGGSNATSPGVFLQSGHNSTVVWQKNVNHWIANSKGNFTVNFLAHGSTTPVMLASVPDTNTPAGTIYTASVLIPRTNSHLAALQVIYYPANPAAPVGFYQCSDIGLF